MFQATQLEKGRTRTWNQVSLIPKLAFLSLFHCAAPVFFTHDFSQVWNRSGKLEAFWLQADHKISRVTAAFGKIQWKISQIPLYTRKTYINPGQDHGEFLVSLFFFFFFLFAFFFPCLQPSYSFFYIKGICKCSQKYWSKENNFQDPCIE